MTRTIPITPPLDRPEKQPATGVGTVERLLNVTLTGRISLPIQALSWVVELVLPSAWATETPIHASVSQPTCGECAAG